VKPFNELTRGEQYLRLLRIEYEDLIRAARFDIYYWKELLTRYQYTPIELENIQKSMQSGYRDIEYYSEKLRELGVENGDRILTESNNSESPIDRFEGITCTTVM